MTQILNRSATAGLFKGIKTVSAVVAAGTASKANTADPELINGRIIGVFPSAGTAADKVLNSVVLTTATGVVTVTLGGNTTADQTFSVVVELASGDIA